MGKNNVFGSRCPKCKLINLPEEKVCKRCGHKLDNAHRIITNIYTNSKKKKARPTSSTGNPAAALVKFLVLVIIVFLIRTLTNLF